MQGCCNKNTLTKPEAQELEQICRYIRKMIVNTITDVQCGHIGGSLSEVEILVALYFRVMNINPADPKMQQRDRFVISKGHASPGLYSVLSNRGYFHENKLAEFDAIDSMLQGHPCMLKTPGIDMSTGSLGQGISVGIGMCLGRDLKKQDFSVYVLLGDGELQEGQNWEAAMYGGKRKPKNFVVIIDCNKVQLAESVSVTLDIEPLADKWRSFGWNVLECDGHDVGEVVATLEAAKKLSQTAPVTIIAHTIKGKGVSFMENKYQWHAKAPNEEQRQQALAEIDSCGQVKK